MYKHTVTKKGQKYYHVEGKNEQKNTKKIYAGSRP